MTGRNNRPGRRFTTRLAAGGLIGFFIALVPLITALVDKGAFDALMGSQKTQAPTPTASPMATSTPALDPTSSTPSSPISTPEASNSPSPTTSSSPTIDSSQLQHSLYSVSGQSCKKQSSSLRCSLIIKSQEDRRLMVTAGGTRVIDQNGNQFNAVSIEVGSVRTDSRFGELLNRTQINLDKDIPLKVNLIFSNVPSQLNQLALVELSASDMTEGSVFTLKAQNIAVTQ